MAHPDRSPEQTRQRLFDAAERGFRAHGYDGCAVDTVARAAGTTSGALYAHFDGKAALFREVVANGLDRLRRRFARARAEAGPDWGAALARYYLAPAHRADTQGGCILPALAADVARADPATRALWAAGMADAHAMLCGWPPFADRADGAERAWQLLALLAGGMALSRAGDETQGEATSAAIRAAIEALTRPE